MENNFKIFAETLLAAYQMSLNVSEKTTESEEKPNEPVSFEYDSIRDELDGSELAFDELFGTEEAAEEITEEAEEVFEEYVDDSFQEEIEEELEEELFEEEIEEVEEIFEEEVQEVVAEEEVQVQKEMSVEEEMALVMEQLAKAAANHMFGADEEIDPSNPYSVYAAELGKAGLKPQPLTQKELDTISVIRGRRIKDVPMTFAKDNRTTADLTEIAMRRGQQQQPAMDLVQISNNAANNRNESSEEWWQQL